MNTMNEVFDRYQTDYLPTLSASTQYEYKYLLPVLRANFGMMVPADLKPKHIGRFLDVQEKKAQQNKLVSLLSSIMGLAVGRWFVDGCESNPCAHVRLHPMWPRTRYITDEEFYAVAAKASHSFRLMMNLAWLLGQRQGDLLSLTWYQVEDDMIRLTQAKTGKEIGIELTDAVKEQLLIARRLPPVMPRWYVVRKPNGMPFSHPGFRSAWNQFMNRMVDEKVVATRFTFHDLRAKCASDKADLVGIDEAAKLLAHGDPKLTTRVYKRSLTLVRPLR